MFDQLLNGDPQAWTIVIISLLIGVVVGSFLGPKRVRKTLTKEEIYNDFIQRYRTIIAGISDPREIKAKEEQLSLAFITLHGFNPMDPIPVEK